MNIRLRSLAMFVVFVLFTLVSSFASTSLALADGGTAVSGVISTDTTWTAENGPYLVQNNILIDTGATLTIDAGTQVIFQGNYYILTRGHIAINGVEGNLVAIRSTSSRQGMLRVESNSNTIQYCELRNMARGVSFENKCSNNIIDHCIIMNTGIGIYGDYYAKNNQILYSNISENSTGISLGGSNTGYIIDGCTFYHNSSSGVDSSYDCDNLIVKNSYFIGNPNANIESGLSVTYDSVGVKVLNNEFQQNYYSIGIWKTGSYTPNTGVTISGNNFLDQERYAISAGNSTLDIQAANNYWNTTDTATIDAWIYDFNDDFDLCKVLYTPVLTEKATMSHPLPLWKMTFDSQGGSSVKAGYTIDRDIIAAPQAPVQTGHSFIGWYKEPSCQNLWNFSTDIVTKDMTLYAGWSLRQYDVSFDSRGGSYASGTLAQYNTTITAPYTALQGYTLAGWYKEVACTTPWNFATDKVTEDITLYAKWTPNTYTIRYWENGGTGSTAASSHVYDIYKALTANGFTRIGHTFTGWATDPYGPVIYTDRQSVKNLTPFDGQTVGLCAKWAPNTYSVRYDKNGGTGGSTATSSHVYDTPQNLSVNGFTKTGYTFAGWATSATGPVKYSNGQSVCELTPTNGATVTLYAKWDPIKYKITTSVNNTVYGFINGSDSYAYGTAATLDAIPYSGYCFVCWLEGSTTVSTSANYTFTVSKARTLKAMFAPLHAVYLGVNNTAWGSVSGEGNYASGSSATVKATPKAGYRFVRWLEGSTIVSTSASYTFTVTKPIAFRAEFAPISYAVTLSVNNTIYGTVSGGGGIAYGTSATVKATPKAGHRFVRWLEGSTVVSTSANFTFTVSKARTLKAEFSPIFYAVTLSVNNTNYGTVSGGGNIAYGLPTTVKATPKAGYRFVRWLEGSTTVSTSFQYGFAVTKARTLKAEFAAIGTPAVTAASAGYNSIKLTWSAVAGAQGYELSRYDPIAKQYKALATVTTTSYTNTGLTTNTVYSYKVRVKCVAGTTTYGSYSPVASAKPLLAAPTNVAAVRASSSSIKVSWYAVAGANGYEVYRATSSSGKYTLMKAVTTPNWTNTGLTAGRIYYYKVKAYRVQNDAKVYSQYSAIVSAKP